MSKLKIYYILLIPILFLLIALFIFLGNANVEMAGLGDLSGIINIYLQPRVYQWNGNTSSNLPANYSYTVNSYRTTNPPYPNRPANATLVESHTNQNIAKQFILLYETGQGGYIHIKQNYTLKDGENGTVFCGITNSIITAKNYNQPTPWIDRYIFNRYTSTYNDYESYINISISPYDSPGGSVGSLFSRVSYYIVYKYSYGLTLKDNLFGTVKHARVIHGNSYTFPTESHTGYNFLGYYTASSGGNKVESINLSINSATTYYARWSAKTYSINLDKQGGVGGTNSTTATYNSPLPTISVPTREGYTFHGYYTEKNGKGTQYYNSNGNSVNNWVNDSGGTLYAYWTIEKYNIKYKSNDKDVGSADDVEYGKSFSLLSASSLEVPIGHNFDGWQCSFDDKIYNSTWTVADIGNNGDSVTFTAVWTPRTDYQVNINLLHPNGSESGSRGTFSLTLENGSVLNGLTDQPSSPNITFGKTWKISNITPATGMHIEKVWLSSGSGSLSPNNSTSSGPYTFTGNFSSNPNGSWDATITIQMAWNTCIVNFAGGSGGAGSMSPMTFTYGQAQTLKANSFKRGNYVFSHWSGNIAGRSVFYNQETLTINPTTHNTSYTLTANWKSVIKPSGSGTSTDPFIVNSVQTLEYIRYQIENLNVDTDPYHYKQTANINLTNRIWTPIGTSSNKFKGQFNGNGLLIEGFTTPAQDKGISNVGLFGYTDSATIEKVYLKNAKVRGNQNVGVIVGNATSGTKVENCIIDTCTVSASSTNGLVIGNGTGNITNILAIGQNGCTSNSLGGGSRSLCLYQFGTTKYRTNSNWADYSSEWGKISANGQVVQKSLFWQADYYSVNQNDINAYNNVRA